MKHRGVEYVYAGLRWRWVCNYQA